MTVDKLGMYYQHSKIFHNEKAYKVIIRKVCHETIESVGVNSELMTISDAQFWLDILKLSPKPNSSSLSDMIALFVWMKKKI